MAEAKKTTKTTTTRKTSTSKATSTKNSSASSAPKSSSSSSTPKSSSNRRIWGINKISFWCIGAMAILYLITSILAICGVTSKVVSILQALATAVAICIVAFLAWKYVAHKPTVWKVLYVVLLLVVLLGIILPMVI